MDSRLERVNLRLEEMNSRLEEMDSTRLEEMDSRLEGVPWCQRAACTCRPPRPWERARQPCGTIR
eukprot:949469-Prorocentrum_minimum.AAC.3